MIGTLALLTEAQRDIGYQMAADSARAGGSGTCRAELLPAWQNDDSLDGDPEEWITVAGIQGKRRTFQRFALTLAGK